MDKGKKCPKCGSGDIWELMGACDYSDNAREKKFEKKAGHTFECQNPECHYRWDEP